jgi:hypothetical protein
MLNQHGSVMLASRRHLIEALSDRARVALGAVLHLNNQVANEQACIRGGAAGRHANDCHGAILVRAGFVRLVGQLQSQVHWQLLLW